MNMRPININTLESLVQFFGAAAAMLICMSIVILAAFQLYRDSKGIVFILLVADVGLVAFFSVLLQLVGHAGGDLVGLTPQPIFEVLCVPLFAIPLFLLIFTTEYLSDWTRGRKVLVVIYFMQFAMMAILTASHQYFEYVGFPEQGQYLEYSMYITPWTISAMIWTTFNSWFAFALFVIQFLRKWDQINRGFFLGLFLINLGNVSNSIREVNTHSIGVSMFGLGSLILAGPVLRQRLFDPLTQLNVQLRHRAEQLKMITHVGQQAVAVLSLDTLLNSVVREIQSSLEYEGVAIFLPDSTRQMLIVKASADVKKLIVVGACRPLDNTSSTGAFGLNRKLISVRNIAPSTFRQWSNRQHIRPEASIPLIISGTSTNSQEELIGILVICGSKVKGLTREDLEVLQILANQIAIAIHNANLFEDSRKQRKAADEANQAKTRFLSSMSHELRTPLQAILSINQFTQQPELYPGNPVVLNDAYRADLLNIETSGTQLLSLINNILDFSKIEAGAIELIWRPVDLISMLEAVHLIAVGLLHESVEFRVNNPSDLPQIMADDMRLKQVIINVVSNACKFTRQGSVTLKVQVEGNVLLFSVADTGIGIPQAAQANLFNYFKQATPDVAHQHGGSGLGLMIAKQFVELHNGEIWFNSTEGLGTTFFFTIPIVVPSDNPTHEQMSQPTQQRVVVFDTNRRVVLNQVLVIDVKQQWSELAVSLRRDGYKLLLTDTHEATVLAHALRPSIIVVALYRDSVPEHQQLVSTLKTDPKLTHTQIIECKMVEQDEWQAVILSQFKRSLVVKLCPNTATN